MKTATDLVLERFLSRYWDMSRPLRGNSTNVSTLVRATWDHLNTADMDIYDNYKDDDAYLNLLTCRQRTVGSRLMQNCFVLGCLDLHCLQ